LERLSLGVTNQQALEEAKKQFEAAQETILDRNQRARAQETLRNVTDIGRIAKEQGLRQDEKFLESLALLLSYGFGDQLEVQQSLGSKVFSANLKRKALRENEALLIRKYSRITERDLIVFGMVTQGLGNAAKDPAGAEDEVTNMKQALINLVNQLSALESSFTGRMTDEIIIDPIAIYVEL
jgi:hypothetical protein